ncbi:endonuclease domain-containing protein [Gracilimonas amylolytica]|uniref:endonuclease domain-containing protein n=1 Tax=Gracilimonas amylolytica TaxID=1749045 RepID=UPI000CD913FE|nr:endonuclease domain-containing protein [Gracilimonas amylolytica]
MSRNKIIPYDRKMRALARKLRKNMTLSEVLLLQQIKGRKLGVQFHWQVPMETFVVDFYCHEIMLAIEIDGSSHDNPESAAADKQRQGIIESHGVHFIRITDKDVKRNLDGVLRLLRNEVQTLLEKTR